MSDENMKIPVFDGHYEHWSEMMENLLRAKQLWNLIDPGIIEPTILDRRSSKAVWDSMKKTFAGNERVKKSMLQKLRRDFEVLEMKNNETILEYFGKVLTISNQMRSNGDLMTDTKIVEKILRTLSEKYTYVVISIEESNNIEEMTIEELQGSLVVHEQKFKKIEKDDEQALKMEEGESSGGRGRGRGRFSPRGRGRGRGRQFFNKETIECYKCHKLGHFSYECPNTKEANFAGFDEGDEIMLMTEVKTEEKCLMTHANEECKNHLWFLDSGCSNHMCGIRERFVDLDKSFSTSIRLGNNTHMNVGGKGVVKLMLNGAVFVVNEVYYVPDLKNCLLSIGQLQQKGLSFLFQSDACKVFHPEKGLLFQSSMSTNRMYPLCEKYSLSKE
ncbi:uncharacterized protein LOC143620049 [Bidens hawaiensis]|uniref:uncharacterized protein LOC143620049 n=1 Tax=Bidens hawaiensis TaxID=980011 RepID=UPI00404AC46A